MKLTFVVIVLLTAGWGCSSADAPPPTLVVKVRTVLPEIREVQVTVTAPATIRPRQLASVAARITAPILRLEAQKGDRVRKDQMLARLVRSDLEAQRAEAVAQVENAAATLEKMTAGTLPGDLDRAQGQVESSAAALNEAETVYKRRQELFAEGAIPEREVLISRTQYEQAKTAHRVAQRSLDLLQKTSGEQDRIIASSQLEQARARLAYIEAQTGFAEIRSPFAGIITEQFLYAGDMAKPDSPIFTVMDLAVVYAAGQFAAESSRELRAGQPCWFEPSESSGQRSSGRITVVNQAVDPSRQTVEAWCEIDNSDVRLKAGEFGQMAAVTGVHESAVTVPIPAVQFAEGTHHGVVWTVGAGGAAVERKVSTGVTEADRVEIVEGLQPGETVIVEGAVGLSEGDKVEAAPAGESPR